MAYPMAKGCLPRHHRTGACQRGGCRDRAMSTNASTVSRMDDRHQPSEMTSLPPILLVENDPHLAAALVDLLGTHGLLVQVARHPFEAIPLLRSDDPSAVGRRFDGTPRKSSVRSPTPRSSCYRSYGFREASLLGSDLRGTHPRWKRRKRERFCLRARRTRSQKLASICRAPSGCSCDTMDSARSLLRQAGQEGWARVPGRLATSVLASAARDRWRRARRP
jgi:hypothetical protein